MGDDTINSSAQARLPAPPLTSRPRAARQPTPRYAEHTLSLPAPCGFPSPHQFHHQGPYRDNPPLPRCIALSRSSARWPEPQERTLSFRHGSCPTAPHTLGGLPEAATAKAGDEAVLTKVPRLPGPENGADRRPVALGCPRCAVCGAAAHVPYLRLRSREAHHSDGHPASEGFVPCQRGQTSTDGPWASIASLTPTTVEAALHHQPAPDLQTGKLGRVSIDRRPSSFVGEIDAAERHVNIDTDY